jgi:DNA helicase-2/ATP-dependent DNA helicase PcrA
LVKLLAGRNGNVTVVADDDQSIFRWRGAAVSNVIQFRKDFPKVKIVTLTTNYRSTQEILDRAYDLIQYNNPDRLEVVEEISKKLVSVKKEDRGEEIVFIHADRVENEAEKVANEIKKLREEKKYEWSDFAILVRANNHAEPFLRALARQGVPYQFLGPGRLFRQGEIIDLIAYLKVLYNFEDSVSLYRILSMDFFDISARDLAAMGNFAKRRNISLFEAAEKIEEIYVKDETKEKVAKILNIINKHLRLIKRETAGQILYYFLEDSGLIQKLINPESLDAQKKAANISKFFDKLKSYEVDHEDATIPSVVDWIELSTQLGESPLAANEDWTEVNAVNILTVHSAKGLEFPVVFLVNLVGQRFPTSQKHEQIPIPEDVIKEILPKGDYHMQEERRLFYVGMTRAKERLFFTAADYYGEGKREKNLSPFIFETLGERLIEDGHKAGRKQLSFLDYEPQARPLEVLAKGSGLRIDYLSYSQIETFKTCPLHYKLKYILNIPTLPSASQSFGSSIHAALRDFYRLGKKQQTGKELLTLLDKNWIKDGYLSKSHENKFLQKGREYLSDYFKGEYGKKTKTISCELPFVVPLDTRRFKNVNPLKIGGRIDRIDELKDGSIEIIDYKTGANVPTQKDIDRDLQMTFYALAATLIKQSPFNKKLQDVKMTFYYFDNQKKISTVRTKEQLEQAVEEIFKIREEIEKSDFACSGGFLCRNCEYKMLCNVD